MGPEVEPDQSYFPDDYLKHILYVTRIYFIYGAVEEELIGTYNLVLDPWVKQQKAFGGGGEYPI